MRMKFSINIFQDWAPPRKVQVIQHSFPFLYLHSTIFFSLIRCIEWPPNSWLIQMRRIWIFAWARRKKSVGTHRQGVSKFSWKEARTELRIISVWDDWRHEFNGMQYVIKNASARFAHHSVSHNTKRSERRGRREIPSRDFDDGIPIQGKKFEANGEWLLLDVDAWHGPIEIHQEKKISIFFPPSK